MSSEVSVRGDVQTCKNMLSYQAYYILQISTSKAETTRWERLQKPVEISLHSPQISHTPQPFSISQLFTENTGLQI
jgi:hypothetical protein